MLFDVPVVGPGTIDVMRETNTTALAVEAGRTLLLDRDEMLRKAEGRRSRSSGWKMRRKTKHDAFAVIGAGSFGANHVRVVHESQRAELTCGGG